MPFTKKSNRNKKRKLVIHSPDSEEKLEDPPNDPHNPDAFYRIGFIFREL